jgi:glutathione S-transferase
MKLYYAPGACSLSPHIVARELDLPIQLVRVDLKAHQTEHGEDFYRINPKGYVPTLQLDDGRILSEGPAIVQYLADHHGAAQLAPAPGTFERAQLQEWLNFISTEVHKSFSPLFNPAMPDAAKEVYKAKLAQRFADIDKALGDNDYLTGAQFTVADAYLFTVLRWTRAFRIDLAQWPRLAAYFARVGERPAVKAALEAEQDAKKAA